jgi:hypothetical protein
MVADSSSKLRIFSWLGGFRSDCFSFSPLSSRLNTPHLITSSQSKFLALPDPRDFARSAISDFRMNNNKKRRKK